MGKPERRPMLTPPRASATAAVIGRGRAARPSAVWCSTGARCSNRSRSITGISRHARSGRQACVLTVWHGRCPAVGGGAVRHSATGGILALRRCPCTRAAALRRLQGMCRACSTLSTRTVRPSAIASALRHTRTPACAHVSTHRRRW
jgi:hypothetical protein